MYKWAVEHMWKGSYNLAKFEDYYDALDYATKWNSSVMPWQSANNNVCPPLCTIDVEDCLQQDKTVM